MFGEELGIILKLWYEEEAMLVGKEVKTMYQKSVKTAYGTMHLIKLKGALIVLFKDIDNKEVYYQRFNDYASLSEKFSTSINLHTHIWESIQ